MGEHNHVVCFYLQGCRRSRRPPFFSAYDLLQSIQSRNSLTTPVFDYGRSNGAHRSPLWLRSHHQSVVDSDPPHLLRLHKPNSPTCLQQPRIMSNTVRSVIHDALGVAPSLPVFHSYPNVETYNICAMVSLSTSMQQHLQDS